MHRSFATGVEAIAHVANCADYGFEFWAKFGTEATDVNITVLSPGPVDTDMWDAVESAKASVHKVVRRFQKLQLIPTAKPEKIARRTVNAVEKNRPFVRDPKRLSINFWLNHMPTRIANMAAVGIKFDPLDRG